MQNFKMKIHSVQGDCLLVAFAPTTEQLETATVMAFQPHSFGVESREEILRCIARAGVPVLMAKEAQEQMQAIVPMEQFMELEGQELAFNADDLFTPPPTTEAFTAQEAVANLSRETIIAVLREVGLVP